jgi:hypothetical protein
MMTLADFLDHSSMIHWTFKSLEAQFVASPEGFVSARDTGIFKFNLNRMLYMMHL